MSLGFQEAAEKKGVPNPDDFLNLQQRTQHYYFLMDGTPNNSNFSSDSTNRISYYAAAQHRRKLEYSRSLSQGTPRRLVPAASYLGVLLCLAASLLILPLVLPPLPPPPLMLLLLLPIGILGMLMVLAFMPSNDTKHITSSSSHTYM
ncbi:ARGOS-like protein [Benincasa hispida]|uniref:ARGOS-like protein n=1 Tax=Benincasa hispida TaxID=102211 RepID=UPI0019022326|nr:ARGOS-like protein [Benincasa hispida]